MGIRIRFRGGVQAGQVVDFGDDREWIRIGRDPGRCDLAISSTELRVGREHVALHRVLGRYRLVLKRESLVLLDGQRAHDDQELPELCELTLGEDGPVLLVEALGESGLAPTEGSRIQQDGAHTRVERLGKEVSRTHRAVRLGLWLLLLVAASGGIGYRLAMGRVARAADSATGAARAAGDALTRMESFTQEVSQNLQRVNDRVRDSRVPFRALYDRAERSVYSVLKRIGTDRPVVVQVATAWSLGNGWLATNAHVAESFLELVPGEELLARNALAEDLRITEVVLHPGYARFVELLERERVFDASAMEPLALIPACDVALMRIATEDQGRAAPALPMASREELMALSSGDPVAYLGFPAEGLVHGGVSVQRPRPTMQVGTLTGLTNFLLERSAPEDAYLLQFSMGIAGGASGSPIFSENGKVVGVLSAGNSMMVSSFFQVANVGVPAIQADGQTQVVPLQDLLGWSQMPRSPVGGVNYGQRIDLLQDLLDPELGNRHLSELEEEWTKGLRSLFSESVGGLFLYLRGLATQNVQARLQREVKNIVELARFDGPLAASTRTPPLTFTADADAIYCAIAVPDRNIDVNAELVSDGQVIAVDEAPDYCPLVVGVAAGKQELQVRIYCPPEVDSNEALLHVRLYRFEL